MDSQFAPHPVIDVSALRGGDASARRDVAAAIGAAARHCGFFYVRGHDVPSELIERLVVHAENFFQQPFEIKMRWYIGNSKHHRGYVPEGEEVLYGGTRDRKEAFDLALDLPDDDVDVRLGTPMLGPNVWPDLLGFREDVGAYYQAVLGLGRTLFRGFALALNIDESYFDALVTKPPSQLRLIHYPHDPDALDAPGIGAHTDYECFTILHATASGLEVMNRSGEWIEAPPTEGAFVVTIGDMMDVWTNGTFAATSHRVRRVSEERYSFPFFCACDYHTLVQPLPVFVGGDRLTRYAPVFAGSHLYTQTTKTFRYLQRGEG